MLHSRKRHLSKGRSGLKSSVSQPNYAPKPYLPNARCFYATVSGHLESLWDGESDLIKSLRFMAVLAALIGTTVAAGCSETSLSPQSPGGDATTHQHSDVSDNGQSRQWGDSEESDGQTSPSKPLLPAVVELPGLSPEECNTAFPPTGVSGTTGAQSMCEYNTEPRLLRLQDKVCALYANGVDAAAPSWQKVLFGLKCYEIKTEGEKIEISESPIEIPSADANGTLEVDGSFAAVATTENGVWFGGKFLAGEDLSFTTQGVIDQMGFRQLFFADIVNSEGDVNPDGIADAVGVGNADPHGVTVELECEETVFEHRQLSARIFPGKSEGGFNSGIIVDVGWGNIPLNAYGISTYGANKEGETVLGFPAERDRSLGAVMDNCFLELSGDLPLLGTLRRIEDGTYVLDSMIKSREDRELLNMGNPMGFARLPDDSGFLGTFSNMGVMPSNWDSSYSGQQSGGVDFQTTGFSFIGMDGEVTHRSLTYKGQTYALDYTSMEIDFGGIPFDLAVTERNDGALLLIHTNRVGYTYLPEVNGLYITTLLPDGNQTTEVINSNGKTIGLLAYTNPNKELFFLSSSAYSSGAFDRDLPYNPQIQIWHAPGADFTTPFSSDGYSAWHP